MLLCRRRLSLTQYSGSAQIAVYPIGPDVLIVCWVPTMWAEPDNKTSHCHRQPYGTWALAHVPSGTRWDFPCSTCLAVSPGARPPWTNHYRLALQNTLPVPALMGSIRRRFLLSLLLGQLLCVPRSLPEGSLSGFNFLAPGSVHP